MAENYNPESKFNMEDLSPNLSDKEIAIVKCWHKKLVHKPKCIVFDLDYTLWPFFVDDQVVKIHKWQDENNQSQTKILDYKNKPLCPYQDVTSIIKILKNVCFENETFHLSIASRATLRDRALDLFDAFGWNGYFDSIQIYSGTKDKHIKNIMRELNLKNFNEILFFDDNRSNIEHTKHLGVIGHQVRRHYGLHTQELIKGLEVYNSMNMDLNESLNFFNKSKKCN